MTTERLEKAWAALSDKIGHGRAGWPGGPFAALRAEIESALLASLAERAGEPLTMTVEQERRYRASTVPDTFGSTDTTAIDLLAELDATRAALVVVREERDAAIREYDDHEREQIAGGALDAQAKAESERDRLRAEVERLKAQLAALHAEADDEERDDGQEWSDADLRLHASQAMWLTRTCAQAALKARSDLAKLAGELEERTAERDRARHERDVFSYDSLTASRDSALAALRGLATQALQVTVGAVGEADVKAAIVKLDAMAREVLK